MRNYVSNGRLDVMARAMITANTLGSDSLGIVISNSQMVGIMIQKKVSSEIEFVIELIKALNDKKSKIKIYNNVEYVLTEMLKEGEAIILAENGTDISRIEPCRDLRQIVLLGTHVDPPGEIARLFRSFGAIEVSLGPLSLFTSHSILYYTWASLSRCRRVSVK